MRRLLGLVAAAAPLAFASHAFAAAFELREFSANAMGTAYAGAAANDADPASLFYNPATLSGVDDWDISINGSGLLLGSSGRFTGATSAGNPTGGVANPHGFIGDALLPSIALRYRLNDRWAIGLTVNTPFGESTQYPANWTGRYYAQTTNLTTYEATPMVSYQVTPDLTLAAGMQIQYAHSYFSEAIDFGTLGASNGIPGAVPGADDGEARLHGHSWQEGYVLGALWKPTPALTLGASYRSELRQDIKGNESFAYDTAGIGATINALTGAFANGRASADVPMPASATGGARLDLGGGWAALAGVEYTNWSSFKVLEIRPVNPANPIDLTETNWRDTWFGSLGAEYSPDDKWTFRGGIAYDEAAVPKVNLSPRIPDADRYWLAGGIGYHLNPRTDLNVSYAHLFTPHSTVAQNPLEPGNALRGTLDGLTNTSANLVSLQVVFR